MGQVTIVLKGSIYLATIFEVKSFIVRSKRRHQYGESKGSNDPEIQIISFEIV